MKLPGKTDLDRLLETPDLIHALAAEIRSLREAVDQLRKAQPPVLVNVQTAAERLGVSVDSVRRMVKSGVLASSRVGRALRVDLTRSRVRSVNADDARQLALPRVEEK